MTFASLRHLRTSAMQTDGLVTVWRESDRWKRPWKFTSVSVSQQSKRDLLNALLCCCTMTAGSTLQKKGPVPSA